MNEPNCSFEPQIGSSPTPDEGSKTAVQTDSTSKFDSSKTQTNRAIDDLKSAARATADAYRGKAEQALGDARERARSFQSEIEQEVRENPKKAIFSVLGIGFLLGLIFRRR
jgi:ElaB/YqjD/DUF883 family membrane-anchored ribosome-binding protein